MGVKAEGIHRVCQGESSNFRILGIPTIGFKTKFYFQIVHLRVRDSFLGLPSARQADFPTIRLSGLNLICFSNFGWSRLNNLITE